MTENAADKATATPPVVPAQNPLESYRWYKGKKVSEIAAMLEWSLYKTRVVLRGDRPVKPEEMSHIAHCTEGAVHADSWKAWNAMVKNKVVEEAPDTSRLKRMRVGDSRAKGKPMSVILFEEHVTHLRTYASTQGLSFSAVIRKIVDEYFEAPVEVVDKSLEEAVEMEQASPCDSGDREVVEYDEEWLSELVTKQGSELNFDEDDVRRFLEAKNKGQSGK